HGLARRVAVAGPVEDCAIGPDAQGGGKGIIFTLEQRVVRECLIDLLIQFERGQLQQPDRLLQLRRQRQMLRKSELKAWFHGRLRRSTAKTPLPYSPYIRK